ncbi:MAG: DUF488 family protein [Pseudomonadota bacterium]
MRSYPRSRFNPQFNRRALEGSLAAAGIAYLYLGEGRGARPLGPEYRRDGVPDCALLAQRPEFRAGLERVGEQMARFRPALMGARRATRSTATARSWWPAICARPGSPSATSLPAVRSRSTTPPNAGS